MNKKFLLLVCIMTAAGIYILNRNILLGSIVIISSLLLAALVFCFLSANRLLKKTAWWNNQYSGTSQFVTGTGYRHNLQRNYDIVNLGSNPARYAFFYESVVGQSWSTGSQGQDMDFEILKRYHSYLKRGGYVLIPIMPFSAISSYLKERTDYWGIQYYSKFAKILDFSQTQLLPYSKIFQRYFKYPLLYTPGAIKYVIKDIESDYSSIISEQPLSRMELIQDASSWVDSWKKEFNISNLEDILEERWLPYYHEAVNLNKEMANFCVDRELNPVFVVLPMTHYLSDLFPASFIRHMIDDFLAECTVPGSVSINYLTVPELSDSSLYFNSLFLNLRGRKSFTNRVLADLSITGCPRV